MKPKKKVAKKQKAETDITLLGYKIKILKNKVRIENKDNIPMKEFQLIAEKLVQYMMDELFITADKVDVEMHIPKKP